LSNFTCEWKREGKEREWERQKVRRESGRERIMAANE